MTSQRCFASLNMTALFDSVTPPALPAGWFATNALGPPPLWVTSNSGVPAPPADTAPNAAFIDDPAVFSDKRLDSRPCSPLADGFAPQLSFRHNFNLEASASIPISASTASCPRSALTVETRFKMFPPPLGSFVIGRLQPHYCHPPG